MNVVSDSSPLIALAAINSLDLLRALYSSIQIPDEVYKEVAVRGRYPATAVANIPWITRRTVTDAQQVAQFRDAGLDQGESEAIALALERPASLLLVDKTRGPQNRPPAWARDYRRRWCTHRRKRRRFVCRSSASPQ